MDQVRVAEAVVDPFDIYLASCPWELQAVIPEFWPDSEYDNAARIAWLESKFDPFAVNDTTSAAHPCGSFIGYVRGVRVSAELSVGYFQVNSCNRSDARWEYLFNARFNAEQAYALWAEAGNRWTPWFFSAQALGLT